MKDFEEKALNQIKQAAKALEKPNFAALQQAVIRQAQSPDEEGGIPMKHKNRFRAVAAGMALLVVLVGLGIWRFFENGAGTYQAVYQALNSFYKEGNISVMMNYVEDAVTEGRDTAAMAPQPDANLPESAKSNEEGAAGADFGETNLQVSGVGEADIVKNDGENLYILSADPYSAGMYTVSIVRCNGLVLLYQMHLSQDEFLQVEEMYVSGDRLVLIGTVESQQDYTNEYWQGRSTKAAVYEIAPKGYLELQREFVQEGDYLSSRMVDKNLYLVSSKWLYINRRVYASEVESLVPHTLDSYGDGAIKPVSADCIAIAQEPESMFTVVSAFSITEDAPVDTQSILSASGSIVYCSQNNLYVVSAAYTGNTEILKFKLSGAAVEQTAKTEIDGWVKDQFSLDEENGFLRVAVTDQGRNQNYLYIYDENLQQVGKTEGLAEGEQIKSVRYIGSMAYMVTFRQTDPLFAIDVSDPANPKVLGELKIPGFSTYLHPMDANTLIGIGYSTDDTGSYTTGLKISLFDVSDPMNPTEISKLELAGSCASEALTNHKAVTWIGEDGVLLMPISVYGSTAAGNQALPVSRRTYGLALSISRDQGIRIKGILQDTQQAQDWEVGFADSAHSIRRITYVGDTLYTISAQSVIAADRTTLALEGRLDLLDQNHIQVKNETSPGEITPYTASPGEIEPFPESPSEITPYTNYTE